MRLSVKHEYVGPNPTPGTPMKIPQFTYCDCNCFDKINKKFTPLDFKSEVAALKQWALLKLAGRVYWGIHVNQKHMLIDPNATP